jgi:predicted TIM-barrel fold metal-dependent hydrolase
MIACPSINPARADAVAELDRIQEKGARLLKIHPPIRGVDLMEPRFKPFFRRCADLRMIVLVHTGHEHSAPVINKHFAAPDQLVLALEQGCTVVACHAGSGWETDEPDQLPQFTAVLDRYPEQLWGDTAVLGTAGRVRDFGRLLKNDRIRERLLHGSDYPFPVAPHAFVPTIGEASARRVADEPNWIKRDLALKQALGIGSTSAERAYALVFGS